MMSSHRKSKNKSPIDTTDFDSHNDYDLNCDFDPNNEDKYGKIYLNETFNLTFQQVFDCLFEYGRFYENFAKLRKIINFQTDDWIVEDGLRKRINRLEIAVGGVIGGKICKNTEHIKIAKFVPHKYCVVEAETYSTGIMYVDCFKLCYTYWIVKSSCDNQTHLLIRGLVRYINKPNFFIKNLIEKMCYDGLKENFDLMTQQLIKEGDRVKKETLTGSEGFSSDDETSKSDGGSPIVPPKLELKATKSVLSRKISSTSMARFDRESVRKRVSEALKIKQEPDIQQNNKQQVKRTTSRTRHIVNSNECVNTNTTTKYFIRFFFVLMIVLIFLNIFLFKRLKDIENVAIKILDQPKFHNYSIEYKKRIFS